VRVVNLLLKSQQAIQPNSSTTVSTEGLSEDAALNAQNLLALHQRV
jgi:hypothetical protein